MNEKKTATSISRLSSLTRVREREGGKAAESTKMKQREREEREEGADSSLESMIVRRADQNSNFHFF